MSMDRLWNSTKRKKDPKYSEKIQF